METGDDAGVYHVAEGLALVQSLDFITPVVDDPYDYGRIAATNSLSDIYAMGGRPITAMNIVGFPQDSLPAEVLRELLRGGLEKIEESGATLVGGHTVDDVELKYGLSVTGVIDPRHVVRNVGAQPGDLLVLTKPLGMGIITTANKRRKAPADLVRRAVEVMATLNRAAGEVMVEVGVHAATDVTGFGLLGHALIMARGSGVGMAFQASAIPYLDETLELSEQGLIPGGSFRNREFVGERAQVDPAVSEALAMIFFDAQTYGGLLMAVASEKVELLLERLQKAGISSAAVIGRVIEGAPRLLLQP